LIKSPLPCIKINDSGSKGMISAKLNFLAPLVLILLIALF
jgi:hypothetical protein